MEDRKIIMKFLSEEEEKMGMDPANCLLVNTTLQEAAYGIKREATDEELVSIAKYLLLHLKGVNIVVTDMIPF